MPLQLQNIRQGVTIASELSDPAILHAPIERGWGNISQQFSSAPKRYGGV
jgi:hypothetical protein